MIRVRVHINETQIIDIHAVREDAFYGRSKMHRYTCFITQPIGEYHKWLGYLMHKYSDGGAKLSAKLLQLYDKKSGFLI